MEHLAPCDFDGQRTVEPDEVSEPIVVIGAGMGGLAAAIRLAHRGERVIVLEKTSQVGGRNHKVTVGNATCDGGPTLVMMLDPFRKLFDDVGERLEDYLDLRLCEPGYRAYWPDGTTIEATTNVSLMVERLRELTANGDAEAYPPFLGRLKSLYRDAIPHFVRKNYQSLWDFAAPHQVAMVARHGMLGNLRRRVESTFRDPRVQMLFSFQTMYLGLSPYEAPWVYATLTYMEYGEGIWFPMGGVHQISKVMAELARSRTVEIRLDCPVKAVRGREVFLESGERITAKAIVCNADLPYAESQLVGQRPKQRRNSCSAFMLYADYAGDLPDLSHHNVFFGASFKDNLDDVFTRHEVPDDPSFYVCLSHKTDPSLAKTGHANLYVLVPVPNLTHSWSQDDAEKVTRRVFDRLKRATSFSPEKIVASKTATPVDWHTKWNLHQGAAFGLSHHTLQSALFRPQNWSKSNPHLYFVGASTVPGNGMPMVLISAELVEQRLVAAGVAT